MKKILFSFLMMFFVISANCSAMTFSQPVEIGKFGRTQEPGIGGGFLIEGSSYNEGDIYKRKGNICRYGKGSARWGNGDDALYLHYDAYNSKAQIGDKNINNTIKDEFAAAPLVSTIMRVDTDSKKVIYILFTSYDIPEDDVYECIGKHSNGEWVKYFSTNDIVKRYFGEKQGHGFGKIRIENDTITVPYKLFSNGNYSNPTSTGEFRFKWDDSAQWFGVERVVY